MKMLSRILSLLLLTSLGMFYAGCDGGDKNSDPVEKVQLEKLSTTWKINTVTFDGVDRKINFTNFTLTLTGAFDTSKPKGPYTYTVGGSRPSPNPWPPAGGNWSFGPDATKEIVRHDSPDFSVSYTVTDSELTIKLLSFTGIGYNGARTSEVEGDWIFTFTK